MARNEEFRHQVGALPVRETAEGLEVCLVTTRETRRWTIPKGWPMPGRKDREAAAIEALEEAGLVGKSRHKPLGAFLYWKRLPDHLELVRVKVFRLDVARQLDTWKESAERQVAWFGIAAAAEAVSEPGLAAMIGALAPEAS